METATLSLNQTGDILIFSVEMYNRFRDLQTSPLCQEELEALIAASIARTDVVEPLSRLVQSVGSQDWDDTNIFAGNVRSAWIHVVAALNDDGALEDEGGIMDDDEELSVKDLTVKARSVIKGNAARKQFEQLLADAEIMDASYMDLREALSYVVETGGLIRPMEDFLSVRDEEDEDWDDADAAARLLWHTISSPEWPDFIQNHPECQPFLL